MLSRNIKFLICLQIAYFMGVATMIYLAYKRLPCNLERSVIIPGRYEISGNGSLLFHNVLFEQSEYYFENVETIRVCPISYCYYNEKNCIIKCSPEEYVLDNRTNRNAVENYLKIIGNSTSNNFDNKSFRQQMSLTMNILLPCDDGRQVINSLENDYTTEIGRLNAPRPVYEESFFNSNSLKYCNNFITTGNSTQDFSLVCSRSYNRTKLRQRRFKYYTHLLAISVVCFAIIFFVYALVPELRRHKNGLLGICLMNHLACVFISYTIGLCLRIEFSRSEGCKIISYVFYYTYTSGKLWSNVLCYELWSTIRSMNPALESQITRSRKIILYSVYAYVTPLLLTIVLYVLDTFMLLEDNLFKPDMGNPNIGCFISNRFANWIFTCAVTGFVLLTNIKLIVDIGCFVEASSRKIKRWLNNKDSSSTNDGQPYKRLTLYSYLCVASGIINALEITAFFFAATVSDWWWFPTDIANSSRGLLTFAVILMNRRTLKILKKNFSFIPLFK